MFESPRRLSNDRIMDKNLFAVTPPMGWNSYDYYDTTVDEKAVKANADYMAEHLAGCGWEYIVIDIEWYAHEAGSQRQKYQYIPFWEVEMDEYSRLLPDPERFPSSKNGAGFKPLADYIHDKGLKFGIHIMRGIPRQAAAAHSRILGSDMLACDIADPSSICFWNPDMYGVRPYLEGSQAYYDSIMQLYSEWGVDFIKVDDICRMDMPSARAEIIMLRKAIQKSGREIVLSLSPGPAKIEESWLYEKYANMWRITDDFWDKWDLLLNMFERCELWQKHVSCGCWPDCDMLPLGRIGAAFGHEHTTNLTYNEQVTMMTLWSVFRSPMMLGCELTKLDDETLKLITNKDVIHIITDSIDAGQVMRNKEQAIWKTCDSEDPSVIYVAAFNFREEASTVKYNAEDCTCSDPMVNEYLESPCRELWSGTEYATLKEALAGTVESHGAKLFKCCASD